MIVVVHNEGESDMKASQRTRIGVLVVAVLVGLWASPLNESSWQIWSSTQKVSNSKTGSEYNQHPDEPEMGQEIHQLDFEHLLI